jgi:hypothetical protein
VPTDDKLGEIRRLYFAATKSSIQKDFARAIDLLKLMASDEERQLAHVYMEGLAEMRKEWGAAGSRKGAEKKKRPKQA